VVEDRWLERIERARLHLYRMPDDTFVEDDEVAGYWVSHATVEPLEMITIEGLIARHAAAGIPLRTEANLWPLWDQVVASSLEYSGIRLRYAQPHAPPS
jgi:hypothetical protein